MGTSYARHHLGRLPVVVSAALAARWQFYRSELSAQVGARTTGWLLLVGYYLLVPFALAGTIILARRCGPTVLPLLAPAAAVAFDRLRERHRKIA